MTNPATHTPGPWHVDESFALPNVIARCFPKDAKCVAVVYGSNADRLMARVPDAPDSSRLADARLIAASPTLLKACKLALMEFERNAYQKKADPEVMRLIEMAIAKAEGREITTRESARNCGCDPGEAYTCEQHRSAMRS